MAAIHAIIWVEGGLQWHEVAARIYSAAAGLTIDHIFSLGIAVLGGVIWNLFGFQYVFLIGVVIAALGYLAASRIPPRKAHLGDETPAVLQQESI